MALELIYTSSPRGLRPGSSGYCTVACTRGLPANYIELLESLSGYKAVYPAGDAQAHLNPVTFSHLRMVVGGKTLSILSRIGYCGADYTGRTNKLAHHLLVDPEEQATGGPAWALSQEGAVLHEWSGEPQILDHPRRLADGDEPPAIARAWQAITGDAGWAGVLAGAVDSPVTAPVVVVVEPGMDVLGLVREAVVLLPREKRWAATFSTYVLTLPPTAACAWRFCLADSPVLNEARRARTSRIIDLREGRKLGNAPGESPYLDAARTGRVVGGRKGGSRSIAVGRPAQAPVVVAGLAADAGEIGGAPENWLTEPAPGGWRAPGGEVPGGAEVADRSMPRPGRSVELLVLRTLLALALVAVGVLSYFLRVERKAVEVAQGESTVASAALEAIKRDSARSQQRTADARTESAPGPGMQAESAAAKPTPPGGVSGDSTGPQQPNPGAGSTDSQGARKTSAKGDNKEPSGPAPPSSVPVIFALKEASELLGPARKTTIHLPKELSGPISEVTANVSADPKGPRQERVANSVMIVVEEASTLRPTVCLRISWSGSDLTLAQGENARPEQVKSALRSIKYMDVVGPRGLVMVRCYPSHGATSVRMCEEDLKSGITKTVQLWDGSLSGIATLDPPVPPFTFGILTNVQGEHLRYGTLEMRFEHTRDESVEPPTQSESLRKELQGLRDSMNLTDTKQWFFQLGRRIRPEIRRFIPRLREQPGFDVVIKEIEEKLKGFDDWETEHSQRLAELAEQSDKSEMYILDGTPMAKCKTLAKSLDSAIRKLAGPKSASDDARTATLHVRQDDETIWTISITFE